MLCVGFKNHQQPFFFKEVSAAVLPLDLLGNNSMDIEFGDLDGDGDLDAVIAMEFRPNVLLLNNGQGSFQKASTEQLPQKNHDSEDIALADFDGDGDLDILFVAEDDQQHEYYLNDGRGFFKEAPGGFAFPSTCNAVVAGDFDGDGDLDLILGNAGEDYFLANDGKGRFSNETKSRLSRDSTVTQDVQAFDMEGDGDLDLIWGNEDGNRLYQNNGKGVFEEVTAERLPLANEETRKVDVADVDGDGDLDLFFSNVNFRKDRDIQNRLLINKGTGFFKDETSNRYAVKNGMHTGDVSLVDLDGDGDRDLVAANLFGGYLQVAVNDGRGHFSEVTQEVFAVEVTGDAISVDLLDLNGDQRLDLYVGKFRGADQFFYNMTTK